MKLAKWAITAVAIKSCGSDIYRDSSSDGRKLSNINNIILSHKISILVIFRFRKGQLVYSS
jgi:hypothetical protein